MIDRLLRACLVIGGVSAACAWTWPGAFPEGDPVAVLVRYHTPNVYTAVVAWYYVAPGVAALLAGQLLISTSRIWFARLGVNLRRRSRLPRWPLSPTADAPAIVVGEVHHPVKLAESPTPEWLTIPERGLYTGVAIFGAVGSGKTTACMHPFARQLFGWQADNPERRAAALVLEVKGDFCHDIRRMLTELDRGEDYIELSLDGRLTWNPLSATWLDAYSLAYTVASLLNQLFGKGKEPFWQQAYTNLVRWIIELYRVLPPQDGSDTPGWVTLRDVYHCAIDKALFAKKIEQAQTYAKELGGEWITIAAAALTRDHVTPLRAVGFQPHPADPDRFRARPTTAVFEYLTTHTITHARERFESAHATEIRLRVEAVHRWYVHDWNTLDNKIRSSIVEGVSVFLSMFDLPSVARVFCPPAPDAARLPGPAGQEPAGAHGTDTTPLVAAPALDAAALERAAIHIARPLGLDPATTPVLEARLGDGSRVAICVPPASPHVAITVRRFGTRSFSAAQLVEQGALPEHIRHAAERTLHTRRNILVSGGTGSGKTTLLNALISLIPDDERIVAIEDTLELRIDAPNCVRFEARGLQQGAVTIRDLVRHALRHRPDHIVVGEVRGGEAADLLQALNTGHGGSLTTVHANNAESALSRLASCAMQGGGDLPWEVTCRGVVDGIAMVIHMTRADGRRFVEEAAYVRGYDAGSNAWEIERLDRKPR